MAERKKIPGAVFSVYNGTDFPFREEAFDIVFIAGVLHHVSPDLQKRLVSEAHRTLKKGGRVYIFEHNPFNIVSRYLVKTCVFDKHARLVSAPVVTHMLREQRFENIETNYITFFPRNKFFSFLHNLEPHLSWCPLGAQYYLHAGK
jgi:SAM-dependent methyltransferase